MEGRRWNWRRYKCDEAIFSVPMEINLKFNDGKIYKRKCTSMGRESEQIDACLYARPASVFYGYSDMVLEIPFILELHNQSIKWWNCWSTNRNKKIYLHAWQLNTSVFFGSKSRKIKIAYLQDLKSAKSRQINIAILIFWYFADSRFSSGETS